MVTGVRTVTTRNKDTMAVATLEDLQGTLEVVVFPRMYATSGGTFAEGSILLVAGRIDHRGEEASVLADAVWVWEIGPGDAYRLPVQANVVRQDNGQYKTTANAPVTVRTGK